MALLYASALFSSTRMRLPLQRLRRFAATDAALPPWAQHIELSYRSAFTFCFNDYYAQPLAVRHILSSPFDDADAGRVWSDWTLVSDRRLGVSTLHLAFAFQDLRLDIENPDCRGVEAGAAFLRRVYQLSEHERFMSGPLAELSRLLGITARSRRNTLGVSRYVHASVVCDDARAIKAPSRAARLNVYRLLFLHPRGVDSATATARLPPAWGSAAFFRLYHQPGGVVSLSSPYPDEAQRTHRGWFRPAPPQLSPAPFVFNASNAAGIGQRAYPSYDLLPEYPPLRYLAVPLLQYAAAHEETLREVHEMAFAPRLGWPPRWPWRKRATDLHLLAASLEGLRLPIIRDLAHTLLERQLQGRTSSASMEMLRLRESRQRVLLTWLGLALAITLSSSLGLVDKGLRWLQAGAASTAASGPPETSPHGSKP